VTVYWCELAWLGGDAAEAGVVVEVEGERITSVRAGVEAMPEGAMRLGGLTVPGFANAHSHGFQRALRGRAEDGRGSFWTWRKRMYELAGGLDPERYFRLARATFAEMALAGVTAVGEFHYLHHQPGGTPYDDPNEIGKAMIAAAAEARVRITLLDACYLHGGIGEPPGEVQRRFADRDADAWVERVAALDEGPGARVGAAIHSVRAVDREAAARVAGWALEHDRPLHAHVSEQPAENEACRAAYGVTPTGLLEQAGALAADFTAVHAIHLEPEDVFALGSSGACCCLCPTTERDLADGVGPAAGLQAAGASLALGSDSHAVIDLLEEARAVELDERLVSGERGSNRTPDLLAAATRAGHRSLGWPDAGVIEPGARADLTTVRLDGVRLAGTTSENVLAAVVFAATASDVDHVVCGGREIVAGGKHLELDVAAELSDAIAAVMR
jgi:formiminoglutamate deiminase